MNIDFDTRSPADYRTFKAIRRLPRYGFRGWTAVVPDEYADIIGMKPTASRVDDSIALHPKLFDYQRDIAKIAIRKRKFAAFVDCGFGKTLILLEFAFHSVRVTGKPFVIVSPLNVCKQTVGEASRWYGVTIPIIRGADAVEAFLRTGEGVAVTNFEGLPEDYTGPAPGGMAIDESSILKSHYGKHGQQIIAMGRGVDWKLCCTGTPAPNDRIEYANHAVFLDQARTPNEFLARYFVNRGDTGERWELKPHSLSRFYRDLSSWCIFLSNPATYGWKDNAASMPPINVHIHDIDLTAQQRHIMQAETGNLIMTGIGGIGSRTKMARLAKGDHNGESIPSHKFDAVVNLVNSWPDESVIVWCLYNAEQDRLAKLMPDAANIAGDTPIETRERLVEDFQSGRRRVLISKPKILGFGLNLQIATRQVFSSLQDSYEQYYQAVKRSNRVGSTRPLNVHIPITQIEAPMVATVMEKAGRVEADTREQEALFRKEGWSWLTR